MKSRILTFIFGTAFAFFVASPILAVATPIVSTTSAACDSRVLGIPPWYRGLTKGTDCEMKSPNAVGGIGPYIWHIVLNVIEMALVLVAYIAVFFIMYGGFLFMTGGSNPGQVEKGRKAITNAVIGLIIAMASIAINNFIFSIISKNSSSTTTIEGGGQIDAIPEMTGNALLTSGLNTAYFIAGTVAVIVIIVAGVMYTASAGDSGRVTKAKNMLTYSIVGLVLVLTAFTITNFVIGRFN